MPESFRSEVSMELLDGPTLSEHLHDTGPLSFRDALPLIEEIAAGLQAIHDAGIIQIGSVHGAAGWPDALRASARHRSVEFPGCAAADRGDRSGLAGDSRCRNHSDRKCPWSCWMARRSPSICTTPVR